MEEEELIEENIEEINEEMKNIINLQITAELLSENNQSKDIVSNNNNFHKINSEKIISKLNNSKKYYQNWNLALMHNDFKSFCEESEINYNYAKHVGVENCKSLLKKYYYDQLDGNLSKQESEFLYRLLKDPWNCSELIRHKIMANIVKIVAQEFKVNIKKILILGAGLGGEYRNLVKIFDNVHYCITDVSESALKSFKLRNKPSSNLKIRILDIFDRYDLMEFSSNFGKFDLVVASGVYRYGSSDYKRHQSAEFIYSNFLKPNGLFCIVEVRQDPAIDNPILLRKKGIQPIVNKKFKTKTRINPTHLVIYQKSGLNF